MEPVGRRASAKPPLPFFLRPWMMIGLPSGAASKGGSIGGAETQTVTKPPRWSIATEGSRSSLAVERLTGSSLPVGAPSTMRRAKMPRAARVQRPPRPPPHRPGRSPPAATWARWTSEPRRVDFELDRAAGACVQHPRQDHRNHRRDLPRALPADEPAAGDRRHRRLLLIAVEAEVEEDGSEAGEAEGKFAG